MERLYTLLDRYFGTYARVVRYLFAGGFALVVDAGSLYILKDILGFTLLPAVTIAFLIGFGASFTVQKFFTFRDVTTKRIHAQATIYFFVTLMSFFLNLLLMYILVEKIHIWYIFAKIIVSGLIAFVSFFVYRNIIFRNRTSHE